jgi:DNA-binding CsgD family transcriptional regulator
MDHLLVVASPNGVPDNILQALRLAGWRLTVTADIISAKHLLHKGGIAAVMVDLKGDHDPERFKILRFVHEFCPETMVIMLHSAGDAVHNVTGTKLVQTLDTLEDTVSHPHKATALDLHHLSPAQKRIAELVAQAYPNREIAQRLKIKEQSVRNELSRIFRKMGIWNRVELALLLRKGEQQGETPTGQSPSDEPWKTPFDSIPEIPGEHKQASV